MVAVKYSVLQCLCSVVYGAKNVPHACKIGTGEPDRKSAYWTFSTLSHVVDENYGELIGIVRDAWKAFETKELSKQNSVEQIALALYAKNKKWIRAFLTVYSKSLGKKTA